MAPRGQDARQAGLEQWLQIRGRWKNHEFGNSPPPASSSQFGPVFARPWGPISAPSAASSRLKSHGTPYPALLEGTSPSFRAPVASNPPPISSQRAGYPAPGRVST